LLESPTYDALVVVVGSSGLGDPSLAAAPVHAAAASSPKPLLVYVNPHALNIVSYLNGVGVPAFDTPEGCAAGLAALRHIAKPSSFVEVPAREPMVDVPTGQLNEAESLALLQRCGIQPVQQCVALAPEDAAAFAHQLGRSVVVKVLSRDIGHKSDVGGVRVGVPPDEVAETCLRLRATVAATRPRARFEGWLVQEQIVGAPEMLLGVVRDPQLGLAMVLGAGGTATEVFDDVAMRLLPLRPSDPEEMLSGLKSRILLEGFRGRPRADISALFQAVHQIAEMAETLGERLVEAEINPLFVLPAGQGVRAADGLVVLGPARSA
jgi:acyl-CoA synthetase (NDP forming)